MRKKLKRIISLLIATITLCLVFTTNVSAYSYTDRSVTFAAHKGFTAKGEIIYSTSTGSEYWFAGRTTVNWPHQEIAVKLYCADTYGGTLKEVAFKKNENQSGSYTGIYADHDHKSWPYHNYTWHQVGAYDMRWFYYQGQTKTELG